MTMTNEGALVPELDPLREKSANAAALLHWGPERDSRSLGMGAYRAIPLGCTMFAPIRTWSCGSPSVEVLTARVSPTPKSGRPRDQACHLRAARLV